MTESTLLAGKLSIVGTPIGNLSERHRALKKRLQQQMSFYVRTRA